MLLPVVASFALACIHVFSQRIGVLRGVPRRRFLSFAGGAAVAFVTLRLLPAIDRGNAVLRGTEALQRWSAISHPARLIFLLSLLLFYGAEVMVRRPWDASADDDNAATPVRVFWLHIGTFLP